MKHTERDNNSSGGPCDLWLTMSLHHSALYTSISQAKYNK